MVSIQSWMISPNKRKKYRVILSDGTKVDFGAIRPDGVPYHHYKDQTPLRAYLDYDHGDEHRRKLYHGRHAKDYPKYSADWLSKT